MSLYPNTLKIWFLAKRSDVAIKVYSFTWAKLIALFYETNPLICSCGREIKITGFVTNSLDIRRILSGMGWSIEIPDFDPLYNFSDKEICQLMPVFRMRAGRTRLS